MTGTRDLARPAFNTLEAVVRDWSRYRRISELQGRGGASGPDDEDERVTRLWVSADRRIREESDTGQVRYGAVEDAANWPLVVTDWFAAAPDLVGTGSRYVAGREGAVYEAHQPAGFLLPGSDRIVGVIDVEHEVLLRVEAWLAAELLMVEEMIEAHFDQALDPSLFAPA